MGKKIGRNRIIRAVILLWGGILPFSCAEAADASSYGRETGTAAERNLAARRAAKAQDAQWNLPHVTLQKEMESHAEPDAEANLPEESVRFLIHHISIQSDSPVFEGWQNALPKYEGKRVGVKGIERLAAILQQRLTEEGYVTSRVEIPDQDLARGTLTLRIIPGRIEEIRFQDPSTKGTWRNAFPTGRGDVLNLRNLEQGLEQMKRVPGQDAAMELLPGKTKDTSIVELKVKQGKPWSFGLSADDGGIDSTGKREYSLNMALYNPTGLNDVLSWSRGKDAIHEGKTHGTENYDVSYSIPYQNYTFSVNTYKNNYYQTIADVTPYVSSGTTRGTEWELARVIDRDRTSKTSLFFRLIEKEGRNAIDGEELAVQHQKTDAYRIGVRRRNYVGDTVSNWELWYQKGMPWFGAERSIGDGEAGNPTTRYGLFGINGQIETPITIGNIQANYHLSFTGQYTKDRLYSTDQLAIGGRWTVRGFDGDNSLSAENGWYLRNELDIPIGGANITPYLAFDIGHVWGPSSEWLLGKNLAGAAIGVKGNIGSTLQYDVFLGVPLYKPEGFKTGKTAAGFSLFMEY